MRKVKIAFLFGFLFSCLFAIFSLVFYFGDWLRLLVVAAMGFFVGVVAAPEFEPKEFRGSAAILQTVSGGLFGLATGLGFDFSMLGILVAVLAGCIVGWSAPFWVKHVQIP